MVKTPIHQSLRVIASESRSLCHQRKREWHLECSSRLIMVFTAKRMQSMLTLLLTTRKSSHKSSKEHLQCLRCTQILKTWKLRTRHDIDSVLLSSLCLQLFCSVAKMTNLTMMGPSIPAM
jgi:hypothetical protein